MFVANDGIGAGNKIFGYTASTKAYDSSKDISLADGNKDPQGLWCNATTIWVANDGIEAGNKIFAYKLSTTGYGDRDTSLEFDTFYAAGNHEPRGLWSDGTTMYVLDREDNKVYAYKMSDKSRDADEDFDLETDNSDGEGLWSDGDTFWVADQTQDSIIFYRSAPDVRGATIWSATMTAGSVTTGGTTNVGYSSLASPTVGSLTSTSFSLDGDTIEVLAVLLSGGDLKISLTQALDTDFTFVVGTEVLTKAAATGTQGDGLYVYTGEAPWLSWDVNDKVSLSLVNMEVLEICDRTWWLRDELLRETPSADTCDYVRISELEAITELDFSGLGPGGSQGVFHNHLRHDDLRDLSSLERLDLSGLGLSSFEHADGIFRQSLPSGMFQEMTSLEYLSLADNNILPRLGDDVFSGLSNLTELDLRGFSRNPAGRLSNVGRCWTDQQKAWAHPKYPWNPRTGSPQAFAPLTSLATYNWDATFDTSHISGFSYTPEPYATNNYRTVNPPRNVMAAAGGGRNGRVALDWDPPASGGVSPATTSSGISTTAGATSESTCQIGVMFPGAVTEGPAQIAGFR